MPCRPSSERLRRSGCTPPCTMPTQRRIVAQPVVRIARALRPAQAQLHRAARHLFGGRVWRALVEDHHDVRIEHLLDFHALFGAQEHPRAIGGRGKGHALLGDLAAMRQRKHLEPAGIGQDGAIPARKPVQPAVIADHLQAGAQIQMEGVAQDDLRTQGTDLLGQDALDRPIGPDRHERRGLNRAARKGQAPTPGMPVGGLELELESGH